MVAAGQFPFPLGYISHRQCLSYLTREIKSQHRFYTKILVMPWNEHVEAPKYDTTEENRKQTMKDCGDSMPVHWYSSHTLSPCIF